MLTSYPIAHKQKSHDICAAFVAGAPPDAEGAVFYGVNETNMMLWDRVRQRGQDWYYIDNAYFDSVRGVQFRVAKNAYTRLDGAGETDGRRFAKLGLPIKPWRERGNHIVVCPQSPSFMRCVARWPVDWERSMCSTLRHITTRPLVVRGWLRDKDEQRSTLPDSLIDAWTLVTHSSAAYVTARMLGVPACGSIEVVGGGCGFDVRYPPMPDDRLRWAGVLADNQFSLDEFRSGEAWAWLNK